MNITLVDFDFSLHKVSLLCFYLKFSILLIFVIVAFYVVESLFGIYAVKSDVYSFVVVMVELLIGRKPLDR